MCSDIAQTSTLTGALTPCAVFQRLTADKGADY